LGCFLNLCYSSSCTPSQDGIGHLSTNEVPRLQTHKSAHSLRHLGLGPCDLCLESSYSPIYVQAESQVPLLWHLPSLFQAGICYYIYITLCISMGFCSYLYYSITPSMPRLN
jgi:hypothetical protein